MNPYEVFTRSLQDDVSVGDGVAALQAFRPMREGQLVFTLGPYPQPSVAAVMKTPLDLPLTKTSWSSAVESVRRALSDSDYDFRPLDRVAEVTGLSREAALDALSAGVARHPWGRPTSDLFTRADKAVSPREVLSGLRAMVAKRN